MRNEHRAPADPIVIAGGHCAYNPEPLAEYVDAFVIGDGEEVVGEIAEVVGAWKRGGRASREAVLRELATIPGVYVPSMYDVEYDGPFIREVRPRFADVPAVVDKRTVADLADWPYPKQQLVPLVEVVHDRLNVEIFRGCTRGCRFCQAGMITRPVRERPEEQVRTMVRDGLARTGYDEVALTSLSSADFSGIDGVVADLVNDQAGTGQGQRLAAEPAGRRVQREDRDRDPEGAAHRPDVRARGRLVAAAPGDQQADPRRGPLQRGRRRVLAGLAAGEALLPHRPADRDGRRHARDRASSRTTSSRSAASYTKQASCTVSVGGFVPKPHTPFQWFGQNSVDELGRKISLLRDRDPGHQGPGEVARPEGDVRRGHREPRRPPDRPGDRGGLAGAAARSRSGASTSRSTAGPTPCRPRASIPTGT